jgi:hypothetical protein
LARTALTRHDQHALTRLTAGQLARSNVRGFPTTAIRGFPTTEVVVYFKKDRDDTLSEQLPCRSRGRDSRRATEACRRGHGRMAEWVRRGLRPLTAVRLRLLPRVASGKHEAWPVLHRASIIGSPERALDRRAAIRPPLTALVPTEKHVLPMWFMWLVDSALYEGGSPMRDIQSIGKSPRSVPAWIRQNVIDAVPLWIQFFRSAVANVRIH